MKIQRLIIPALVLSALQVNAQKSVNPFATNRISIDRSSQGSFVSQRNNNITNTSNQDKKITSFVNCWIRPITNNVNSNFPEYTPVLNSTGNMMFFTARRPENTGNKKTVDPTYKAEDIYYAYKDAEGNWGMATPVSGKINTSKNEAITWISEDGKKMILCQNEDLFESHFENGAWTKPEPMKAINSEYRETHASYSPDGNTLFFTTDNPSEATIGGLDICMVKRDQSGEWGKPVLVENINSTLNEEDPTLAADGKTLYFSSQGFESIGGYDIFRSTVNGEQFSTPENIGYPINTVGNEPFISFSENGRTAFLSSDRGESNEQNIYEVTFIDHIKVPLLVEIYDADTKELITSDVELTNSKKGEDVYMENITLGVFGADQLDLEASYVLQATAKNYSSAEINISTVGLHEFDPDTFKMVEKIYLKADKKEVIIPTELKDNVVYFEYGKSTLTHASVHTVNKIKDFLQANPTAEVVIHAHTDNRGSQETNYVLSHNRGNAITDWFVQNGIDASRILVKGYGEDKPIVHNETEDSRAKNRRAEIEIILMK